MVKEINSTCAVIQLLAAMLRISLISLLLSSTFLTFGQTNDSVNFEQFTNIERHFESRWKMLQEMRAKRGATPNAIGVPTRDSLFSTRSFNLSISDNPLILSTEHLVLKNPYFTDDFDDYDDNYINYPISFSVIFDNAIISLFRNGKFVCHSLDNIERDLSFEEKLNTKNFKHHWVVDNNLYGQVGQRIYVWLDDHWSRAKINLPVRNQPIIFEDSDFIAFRDCHGEWGGTIYFYDRISGDTYFTESTCSNSVLKKDGKYFVLAHLGHMMGSSEVKMIEDPRLLTRAKKSEINKRKGGEALGYSDNSGAFQKPLDMFEIQLFSTFNHQERQLYIAHIDELTFLAEIDGADIQIVHPLFNSEIYTHDPITRSFGDYILMNLDFYGTTLDKEVSMLILHENKILKIDWNEDQSR